MTLFQIARFFPLTLAACALCVLLAPALTFAQQMPPPAAPALYEGKTVGTITIKVRDIFEGDDLPFLYSTANALKKNTRTRIIKQELLFKEGDKLSKFLVDESKRVIRSLRYIRAVEIIPVEHGDMVDIMVDVQDTWSIIPQLGFSSGDGRDKITVGVEETNLYGYGKRVELLYDEEDSRESVEAVYHDRRLWGSKYEFLGGVFSRNDGDRYVTSFGSPFRSLIDRNAWNTNFDYADTIARLFENGDERFIFRQNLTDTGFEYNLARGNPEIHRRRYSLGWRYEEATFDEAEASDFEDLNLDPQDLNQDPSQLPENRRFSGPSLSFESIEPDYISLSYVDRFERVEDYNLGNRFAATINPAPEAFGSLDDAILFSTNASTGYRFSNTHFMRGEIGIGSRYETDGLENTLARTELKYYNVLGMLSAGDLFLGRHTIASSFFLDYGDDLDRDRELLIGGDNALRGYEARTFTGDKRYALNVEDRVHLVDDVFDLLSIGMAFFADVGGSTRDDISELFTDETYADLGLGLRFALPVASGARVVRADVAFPLRDGPDGSGQFEPRILLSGGQLFGASLRSEGVGAERATVGVGFDR